MIGALMLSLVQCVGGESVNNPPQNVERSY